MTRRQYRTSNLLLVLAPLLGSVIGCSHKPAEVPTEQLSVSLLSCGNITIHDLSALTPGKNEGVSKELTDTCFLVQHPEGTLLWETGIADDLGPTPVSVFGGLFSLSVTNPLRSQLGKLGVEPDEIDYLALSHFHDDHSGNANLFASAKLLIQENEANAAFGENPEDYGMDPATYSQISETSAVILSGKHDVFGDGTVVIYPAFGHTPGHQVLFLDLAETGPIVLSGDLYHTTEAREERSVPSFNSDPEQSRSSMSEIEQLITRTQATMWIQHDLEQMDALRNKKLVYR